MKLPTLLLLMLCLLMWGCASVNASRPEARAEGVHSTLLIYRQGGVQAGLADAYIGNQAGYFAQLGKHEYVEFSVDAGLYQLAAKAQGSVAAKQAIHLASGGKTCVLVRPNSEDLYLLVIPFFNAFVPSFVLEETACPSQEQLASMTKR